MIDPPIKVLRSKRARIHHVLERLGPLVAGYRKKLARKGITLPDRQTIELTRLRLQQTFSVWAKRGIVVSVGEGKTRQRVLAYQSTA